MPGFPTPGRPGGEHDEPLLDMIFDGRAIPPDAPREMHDLERMLAALAGPAEPGELAGEAAARAAFIGLASPAGISPAASRPAAHQVNRRPASHRVPRRRPARRRAGLIAALCATAAVLVSTAAAYAGVLPERIQQMAHVTVGAPAPRHHDSSVPSGSRSRRDTRHALGPASRRTGHPAAAAGSPGHGRVVPSRHETPWISPPRAATCPPRPWVYQDPALAAHGRTLPDQQAIFSIFSLCSGDPGPSPPRDPASPSAKG
jgi:hypothetical protein